MSPSDGSGEGEGVNLSSNDGGKGERLRGPRGWSSDESRDIERGLWPGISSPPDGVVGRPAGVDARDDGRMGCGGSSADRVSKAFNREQDSLPSYMISSIGVLTRVGIAEDCPS